MGRDAKREKATADQSGLEKYSMVVHGGKVRGICDPSHACPLENSRFSHQRIMRMACR